MTTRLHLGDCLEVLPTLPNGCAGMVFADLPWHRYWMEDTEIVRLYQDERWTLRRIADKDRSNHHKIRRALARHGIKPRSKKEAGIRGPVSAETKEKMSIARLAYFAKGNKPYNLGRKASDDRRRINIAARMGSLLDFKKYPVYERLLFLTKYIAKHRKHLGQNDATRKDFLDKFYHDSQFHRLYDAWVASGKSKWYRPSIDHITPISRGGTFALDNLRFITWFENRAKADMTLPEWESFRRETGTDSALFIGIEKDAGYFRTAALRLAVTQQ